MDVGCYCISFLRYLLPEEDERHIDVVSATCKLAYPRVDQSVTTSFLTPSGIKATIKCSIFQLIPDNTLEVVGEGGSKLKVTNWVAPHLLYNKIIVSQANNTEIRSESYSTNGKESTYSYQLRAFVNAVLQQRNTANNVHNFHPESVSDYLSVIRNSAIIDTIYKTLGLPLRGSSRTPTTTTTTTTTTSTVKDNNSSEIREIPSNSKIHESDQKVGNDNAKNKNENYVL